MPNRRYYRRLPEWVATKVRLRDRGICAACGVDTATLQPPPPSGPGVIATMDEIVCNIDHIVPIEFGGAELDLENLQTLCVACHNRKSRQQAAQAAEIRQRGNLVRILQSLTHGPRMAGEIAIATRLCRHKVTKLLRSLLRRELIFQERAMRPYSITAKGQAYLDRYGSTITGDGRCRGDECQKLQAVEPFTEIVFEW